MVRVLGLQKHEPKVFAVTERIAGQRGGKAQVLTGQA